MSSHVTRIDHVGFAVPDLDEAKAFYAAAFGLEVVHEEVNEEQGVREAIVFGVPDSARGEAVIAVVVPLEGQVVRGEELRSGLKDSLSAYKIPGEIIVARFEDIPRTDSGKSRKGELKKLLPALREAAARA